MSDATTKGIRVTVTSAYVPERSCPSDGRFVFAYRVRIENHGAVPARLVSRHWIITDAHGVTEEVRGPGVVGLTPEIEPGRSFEYSSFCPLRTPFGTMEGAYRMMTPAGGAFDARIAPFNLAAPQAVN